MVCNPHGEGKLRTQASEMSFLKDLLANIKVFSLLIML